MKKIFSTILSIASSTITLLVVFPLTNSVNAQVLYDGKWINHSFGLGPRSGYAYPIYTYSPAQGILSPLSNGKTDAVVRGFLNSRGVPIPQVGTPQFWNENLQSVGMNYQQLTQSVNSYIPSAADGRVWFDNLNQRVFPIEPIWDLF